MLSNPIAHNAHSALQTRQRLHRRQRSTPTAFEAMKTPANTLPPAAAATTSPSGANVAAMQQQHFAQSQAQLQQPQRQQPSRQLGHRRGQSLDIRRQQLQQRQQRQQDIRQMQQQHQHQQQQQQQQQQFMAAAAASVATNDANDNLRQGFSKMVGNHNHNATNQGLSTTQQQHVLRETQQQRTVRPGGSDQPYAKQSRDEALHLAPQGTTTTTTMTQEAQQYNIAGMRGAQAARQRGQQQMQQQRQQQQLQRQHQQHQQRQQQEQQQQQDCVTAPFDFYNDGPSAVMMRKTLSGSAMPTNQQDFQLFMNADQQDFSESTDFINFDDADHAAAAAASMGSAQGWTSEDETSSTRRTSRRVSNGIMDRVTKFEGLAAVNGMSRPATPPHQNDNAYFPPTPTETPHERMAKHNENARPDRFADDYDGSMEETIKPMRANGNRSNRSSGVFVDMRQQAEAAAALATPPRSNMVQMPVTPASFMNMSNVSAEFVKIQNGNFGTVPIPADMQHLSPPLSQQPTPASAQGVFDTSNAMEASLVSNGSIFDNKPDLWSTDFDSQSAMPLCGNDSAVSPSYSGTVTPSRRRSPHRRNESIASIASAASIASINIEETRTETGVTLDDIALYIEGPNPVDGKWRCLYENCDKRFGRKENIKSHVQTHLNDRQYQCPHCHKCFVRQHDLKRHAKIHTGIKPYPCECGNMFARHDALTRHRQRGMCVGAFDGAVRKIGKRGRPRKSRPNLESRREKSSRTRSRNKTSGANDGGPGSSSSPEESSQSGYSDNSAANSPRTDDSDNPFDDEPFDAMDEDMLDLGFSTGANANALVSPQDVRGGGGTMNPGALTVSSAPMPGAGTATDGMSKMMPGVSPSEHAALVASPSAMSHYSYVSRASLPGCGNTQYENGEAEGDDLLPAQHVTSPAKSVASHYTQHPSTPPGLSASSSPPHSSSRFFNLDPNSSCTEDDSVGMSAPLTSGCGTLGMDMSGLPSGSLDDDMMLMKAFTADDVLVQLDNSGLSMLNTSRFDDDYGLFTNNDDVFFGTS